MIKTKLAKFLPAGIVGVVVAASFIVGPSITGTFASCGSGGTFTANPASPHAAGGTIVLTATAACGGYGGGGGYGYLANVPQFRFWELDPGSRWSMVQDYSAANTHSWNTVGLAPGTYMLEVDIRSADEVIPYDTVKNMTYILSAPAACTGALLTVTGGTGATTGFTGGAFTMHGASSSCTNPVYKFWVQDPGRAWSIVQQYSSTTSHIWGPVGTYHVGDYRMEVDVRDASESTTYDSVSNITYHLAGCTAATITPVPSGGVHGAVNVTLTATATCPGTATYRFWIFDAGGTRWSMVRDYSTTNTYTWSAANQKAGVSKIEVDVRDQGSQDTYEFATQGQTDTLT